MSSSVNTYNFLFEKTDTYVYQVKFVDLEGKLQIYYSPPIVTVPVNNNITITAYRPDVRRLLVRLGGNIIIQNTDASSCNNLTISMTTDGLFTPVIIHSNNYNNSVCPLSFKGEVPNGNSVINYNWLSTNLYLYKVSYTYLGVDQVRWSPLTIKTDKGTPVSITPYNINNERRQFSSGVVHSVSGNVCDNMVIDTKSNTPFVKEVVSSKNDTGICTIQFTPIVNNLRIDDSSSDMTIYFWIAVGVIILLAIILIFMII